MKSIEQNEIKALIDLKKEIEENFDENNNNSIYLKYMYIKSLATAYKNLANNTVLLEHLQYNYELVTIEQAEERLKDVINENGFIGAINFLRNVENTLQEYYYIDDFNQLQLFRKNTFLNIIDDFIDILKGDDNDD